MPGAEAAPSAAVGAARWAARYLPASLRGAHRGSDGGKQAPPPPPPPVSVPLRLRCGQEGGVQSTAENSLEELKGQCERELGIPAALQQLVVEELPTSSGLHSVASSVASRHQMRRQLADWSTFLLLPEGLRRELRGEGLAGWLRRRVWEPLQEPRQAPPGTVWVLVATLDGGRHHILVRGSCTLRELHAEVRATLGLPAAKQRLVVVELAAAGRALRALRALTTLLLAALAWLLAALRWGLGLPLPGGVQLVMQTESGREVELAVSPDITLREMQQLVWERHGEQLSLQRLSLSPERQGGAAGPGKGSPPMRAGTSTASSSASSPARRRLWP